MKTPVQIDFQNHAATESQRSAISKHVAELERMFGGIIAGRVVVEGATKHHHTGCCPRHASSQVSLSPDRPPPALLSPNGK